MAKCDICDKKVSTGRRISINRSQVSRRAIKKWQPNVKKVKITDDGTVKTINMCTRCIRSSLRTGAVTRAM